MIINQPSDTARQRILLNQVRTRISHLSVGQHYSLAKILGEDFWENTVEPHQSLGQCFSDLVANRRVPFVDAGLTSMRHNKYKYTN
jgi:hypothetical protein